MWFKRFHNDADGTVKSPEEIKKIVEETGVDTNKPIVTSCGAGITASYVFAALKHAGVSQIALYDGSWSEYVSFYLQRYLV